MARVESPLPSGEAGTGTASASVAADRTIPENSGSDGRNPVGPDGVSSARPDAHALPGDADAGGSSSGGISLTDDDFADVAARDGRASGSPDSAARSTAGHDAVDVVIRLDARSGDSVNLTDISFIYEGTYVRQGPDLLLIKPDGTAVLIENYFSVEFMPDITGAFWRRLTPELVKSFLQPEAPGQTASLNDNQVAQAQGESIGSVETLTGQVYAVRPDGTRVLLQAGDPVFQGDQIETARGGSIKITFLDGTIFTLGGDARLALDEMVYDPATQTGESAFSILKGGFLFVSGQIAQTNPNDMTVNTPVATIGIRGTIVTGEVSGDLTDSGETFRFTIVDGEISVTAGTQTIVLSENFATAVGSPDAATGGLSLSTFADNIQNVIARNATQFKALSPNDLQQIEFAIKQSVEARTGQPLELNLTDIVNSAPDPNNDIETDDNGSEEGPNQGTEEGGGIDSNDE